MRCKERLPRLVKQGCPLSMWPLRPCPDCRTIEHHIAHTAVPVFVNAVKADGDGILRIEQQGKDKLLIETRRIMFHQTVQPGIDFIKECHITVHVHGRMVKTFPLVCEFFYRVHFFKKLKELNEVITRFARWKLRALPASVISSFLTLN